jgi:hypothetical protein
LSRINEGVSLDQSELNPGSQYAQPSQMTLADPFFSPVARHFPNQALGSEFTVELRAKAFTAVFDLHAFATLPAKTSFVLLTDGNGFTILMVSAPHLYLHSIKVNRRRARRDI